MSAHVSRVIYYKLRCTKLCRIGIAYRIVGGSLTLPAFFRWEIGTSKGKSIRLTCHDSTAGPNKIKIKGKKTDEGQGKKGCG